MRRSQAVAVVVAALALGVAAQYLFVRERIGVNATLATALFLAAAWRSRDPGRALRRRDLWLPVGALAFGGLCALRADPALLAFDATAAIALALGTIVALRGVSVTDLPLVALLEEALAVAGAGLAQMAGALAIAWPALRALAPARSSHASGYVAGLLLATPFLLVFAALFSSADAVFQKTLADALDLARLRELFADVPSRAVVLTAVAWTAGGALARLSGPEALRDRGRMPALIGAEAVTAMLVAIDLLFALFVVIQIAYLFGGRDTVVAAGMAYSAYARRGFFELVAVASLVGGLLFVSDLVISSRIRAYRAAALVLIALTSAVLASAAIRMDLYQKAYGWTELRFYACVAIGYLAVALAILAWAVTRSRIEIALQRLFISGLVVALVANAIGPAGLVARANIERFTSPETVAEDTYRDIDLAYLVSLGDGAIPTIVELLPTLPDPERTKLDDLLRFVARRRQTAGGWQSWNLDRARAEALLAR